jgi:hypothetical protein
MGCNAMPAKIPSVIFTEGERHEQVPQLEILPVESRDGYRLECRLRFGGARHDRDGQPAEL